VAGPVPPTISPAAIPACRHCDSLAAVSHPRPAVHVMTVPFTAVAAVAAAGAR